MVRHACGVALLDCAGLRDCAAGLLRCWIAQRFAAGLGQTSAILADVADFGIGKGWAGG